MKAEDALPSTASANYRVSTVASLPDERRNMAASGFEPIALFERKRKTRENMTPNALHQL